MGVGVGPAEAGLPALTDVLSGSGFGFASLSRIWRLQYKVHPKPLANGMMQPSRGDSR